MRLTGAVLAPFAAALSITDAFAGDIGPSRLLLHAIDAKSGAPIDGVIVAASEHYYWTGFHSSGETCFRAATQALRTSESATPFVLPAVQGESASRVVNDTRHVEILAYRRGYCALQPYAPAGLAGFIKWGGGTVKSPKFDEPITLAMKASNDSPQHRARYLALVAQVAGGQCREFAATIEPMREALLDEAHEIARNGGIRQELFALRVEEAFREGYSERGVLGTLLQQPAERGDVPTLKTMIDWGRSEAYATYPRCLWNRHYCLFPNGPRSEVRVTEPFNIDAADERGFSALMAAAYAVQTATARLLLDRGADVNALDEPGGYSALDLVLSRAREDFKETGPEGIDGHLLRMIDLLKTASPSPTIHPLYRAELLDQDKWKLGPRLTAFWLAVRERVLPLQPRRDVTIDCQIERTAKTSLGLDRDTSR